MQVPTYTWVPTVRLSSCWTCNDQSTSARPLVFLGLNVWMPILNAVEWSWVGKGGGGSCLRDSPVFPPQLSQLESAWFCLPLKRVHSRLLTHPPKGLRASRNTTTAVLLVVLMDDAPTNAHPTRNQGPVVVLGGLKFLMNEVPLYRFS